MRHSSDDRPDGHLLPASGEREALLRGEGRFTDDLNAGATAVFVRSPYAFALIKRIDLSAARAAQGVLGVFSGQDLQALNLGSLSQPVAINSRDGRPQIVPFRPCLAVNRVVHIGEPIVIVIADTPANAADAAELVEIAYEPLDPVMDVEQAIRPEAPQLWPEAPGNIALDWAGPAESPTEKSRPLQQAIDKAAHVVRLQLINQRIAVASLEPRAAWVAYEPATDSWRLIAGSQGAATLRNQLARAMAVRPDQLAVTSGNVGGAFGMKTPAYPEYVAMLLAAREIRRPVRWTSTRLEAFQSDMQARDTVMNCTLALDAEGRFTALTVDVLANMGAYLGGTGGAMPATNLARCLPTVYDIPQVAVTLQAVFTNTPPVGPYRGAGRPEANYAVERLIDAAADKIGVDRVELRRRNMIRASQMPYATPFGMTFDSGDFPSLLDMAVSAADYAGFEARRRRSAAAGKLRGLGIACFLEHAGGAGREGVRIDFGEPNVVRLEIDAQTGGQSHRAVFGRLAADSLDVPMAAISVGAGDSRHAVEGSPTIGSRSAMNVSAAIHGAAERVISNARKFLEAHFGVEAGAVSYAEGVFVIAGSNRSFTLFEVAEEARKTEGSTRVLDATFIAQIPHSFPNGCHIAEVELDPATGQSRIVAYTAVDDCGTMLDQSIVEAQIHGGVAQGLGQVLFERLIYDGDGQLVTGTFMDYPMPRAADAPWIATHHHSVACVTNPLGVKGVGEAGTTGAICAVANAIVNALPAETRHSFQMPATPETIWRACRNTPANKSA